MIKKADKLVEATMLALQGKLELKENKVSRKTKKSEGIDVNVDDTTIVSVEGNETIVDTQDATVIVNKKEDEFMPETSDDVPMEAPVEEPTVDAPVAPDDDMVEVPADDTVMPEEVVDEPVDTELPEDTLGESKNINNIDVKTINVKGLSNAWKVVKYKNKYYQLSNDEYTKFVDNPEKFLNTYMIDGYRTLNSLISTAKNDAVLGPLSFKENKKFESVEIEVSDDGKEVEVTTDNGEEVEVKDETPEENEDDEVEDTETEVPAEDEPSIDEMIEESKKVTEDINESNVRKASIELNQKDKDMGQETATMTGMIATRIADIAEELGDDYSEWLDTDDVREMADEIVTSKMWTEFNNQLDDFIRETIEDKVDWIRRDEPASRYYDGNPDLEESKKVTETQDLKIFDILNDEDTQTLHRDIDMIADDIDNHMIRPATIKSAEALFSNLEYMFTKMNPEYKYTQSYIKNECDKKVEDTEEYLQPRYDSRASFYKKAKVVTKDNGDEELYSYGTHVGGVRGGKPYSKGRFSQTTSRHQKEFFKQRGVDPNKVDVEEGKQADRNEEEIEAKRCSNCIKHENKARSKKVQEMIARRQKKSEALNSLNKTVKRHRAVLEHKKVQEAKNDLGINEEIPKKEEPVPNTEEANLKVESKFSSKSFNEALTKYYKDRILAVENVEVTKLSKTRVGLKIEANLLSKSGKLKRAICIEAKKIQTGKSFDKYEIVETKGLVKENKLNNTKITMTTFTNKHNVIECRYILNK